MAGPFIEADMIAYEDITAAAHRLAGQVRQTPVIKLDPLRSHPAEGTEIYAKLENLQITGSFKARGAINRALSLDPKDMQRGLVAASGGNHGAGVAYAGHKLGVPARIYLPGNTPPDKIAKLESWGAEVIIHGDVWDDANEEALRCAEQDGLSYFHPFADEAIIAGQGTIGLEMAEMIRELDILIVAIGGGGLISGVSTAAKAINPDLKIIGVEPVGAATLHDSLAAKQLVTLPAIKTAASSLAPRRSEQINLDIISQHVDQILLLEDEEMVDAAHWLWSECGLAVELSAAAGMAALQTGKLACSPGQKICSIICGSGRDGLS